MILPPLDSGSTELRLTLDRIQRDTQRLWLMPEAPRAATDAALESERHWVLTGLDLVECVPEEWCKFHVIVGCFTKVTVSATLLRATRTDASQPGSYDEALTVAIQRRYFDTPYPLRVVCPMRQNLGIMVEDPHGPLKVHAHWRQFVGDG